VNFAERALEHARKAMKWQEKVAQMEDDTLDRVRARKRRSRQYSDAYYQAQDLRLDFEYKQAVANRNAQEAQVQLYGMAAIMAKILEQDQPDRGEPYPHGKSIPKPESE